MASLVFISLAIIVLSYNIPYYVVPPRVFCLCLDFCADADSLALAAFVL